MSQALRDLVAVTVREIRSDFHKGRRYRLSSAQRIRSQASIALEALIEQLDAERLAEEDEKTECPTHKVPYLSGICIGCRWNLPAPVDVVAPVEPAGEGLVVHDLILVQGGRRS